MEDDLTLLRRAQSGDEAAFELLVRRHSPRLWRVAHALTEDDETAEEIVQDTFLKAHRSSSGFRGDSSVVTWLHTICHRTALDRRRRPRRHLVPLDGAKTLATRRPIDDRIVIEEALRSLADDERAAFVLVAILGYPSEEAAGMVGVPASTVRSRVGRARRRLAEAMDDDMEMFA